MKSKFNILFVLIAICLSSCVLKSRSVKKDYLFSKYQFKHVADFSSELFEKHSFISAGEVNEFQNYFSSEYNYLNFLTLHDQNDPVFLFSFKLKDNTYAVDDCVSYRLSVKKDFGDIVIDKSFDFLTIYAVKTFPNYWLRIHCSIKSLGENNNLILEYKRN